MLDLLKACIAARLNMVISGGTGSGKTTLLNAASSFISSDERLITIEDAAELNLQQRHIVRMESRPPAAGGPPPISIRQMVVNALRMRPDRIIVGEVRSGEALDVIVHVSRFSDGTRKVSHITECQRMEGEIITMQDVITFEKTGLTGEGKVTGRFRATGVRPKFAERFKALGIDLPGTIFTAIEEVN